MLVFTRKKGEKVIIGDNIVIEILEVLPKGVKIGFTAPTTVKIYREEVYRRIIEENRKSQQISENDLFLILKEISK